MLKTSGTPRGLHSFPLKHVPQLSPAASPARLPGAEGSSQADACVPAMPRPPVPCSRASAVDAALSEATRPQQQRAPKATGLPLRAEHPRPPRQQAPGELSWPNPAAGDARSCSSGGRGSSTGGARGCSHATHVLQEIPLCNTKLLYPPSLASASTSPAPKTSSPPVLITHGSPPSPCRRTRGCWVPSAGSLHAPKHRKHGSPLGDTPWGPGRPPDPASGRGGVLRTVTPPGRACAWSCPGSPRPLKCCAYLQYLARYFFKPPPVQPLPSDKKEADESAALLSLQLPLKPTPGIPVLPVSMPRRCWVPRVQGSGWWPWGGRASRLAEGGMG